MKMIKNKKPPTRIDFQENKDNINSDFLTRLTINTLHMLAKPPLSTSNVRSRLKSLNVPNNDFGSRECRHRLSQRKPPIR